jgi:hypothetical protein
MNSYEMHSNDMPVWEQPPVVPRRLRDNRYAASAAMARTRPGKWVRMPGDFPLSTASQIRLGKFAAFRDGRWEATSRGTGDGGRRAHVWVRYLGAETAQG